MSSLYDLATVIRSKNSGPFEVTFDAIFSDEETYRRVKESGLVTKEAVAALYGITQEKVTAIVFFDQAKALKITLLRRKDSGSPGERDTYGAQQHAPLVGMFFPF